MGAVVKVEGARRIVSPRPCAANNDNQQIVVGAAAAEAAAAARGAGHTEDAVQKRGVAQAARSIGACSGIGLPVWGEHEGRRRGGDGAEERKQRW